MRFSPLYLFVFVPSLFFASALNFRLRFDAGSVHIGGAEAAIAPYDLVFIVMLGYFFMLKGRPLLLDTRDKLNRAAVGFVLLSFLSIFNSGQPDFTFLEFVRHIKVFFLFLLLRRVFFLDERSIHSVCRAALLIVFVEFAISALQLMSGTVDVTEDAAEVKEVFVEGGLVRVAGTLRHPNLLALFLNMLMPFIVFGVLHLRYKIIYMASALVVLGVIMLTYSRTQMALYFVIVLISLFVMEGRRKRALIRSGKVLAALVPALLVVISLVLVNAEELYERFFNAPETNTSTRLVLNAIALGMIFENPLIGIGWNSFVDTMWEYDPFKMAASFQYPVHNMYLLIFSETGILGLLSYLYLLYRLYKCYLFGVSRLKEVASRNLMRVAGVLVLIVLLTGLQGWSFRADSIQFMVWVSYALIAAMYDRAKKEVGVLAR